MEAKRRSRTARRFGVEIEPTERDLAVLYALGRMKILSTRQIGKLHDWSLSSTSKRMRRLFDAHLASCFAPVLGGENYYGLTPAGLRLVVALYGEPNEFMYQVVTRLGRINLKHLVLINDYWIELIKKYPPGGEVELVKFEPEWELRNCCLNVCIVPDGMFSLNIKNIRCYIALEAVIH